MIHIEKDQRVLENENLRIATTTGDYEDGALIEFYNISDPEMVAGSFQAQYVKYGSLVYKFNDHKELGTAILKIDPTSTHTAASYVRMTNELLAQMEGGSLEPTSLDQALATEQIKMEDAIDNPLVGTSVTTSTQSGSDNQVTDEQFPATNSVIMDTPSSTPISTSTPENIDVNAPTSTPADITTTTTTPSIIDDISDVVDTVSTTADAISNVVETITDTTSTPSTP